MARIITTIGEHLAYKNVEFEFLGNNAHCKSCKVKHICFNLKPYHRYKILKIREKRHSCSIHDGDAKVVEVELLPLIAAIDKKYTKGSKAHIKSIDCDKTDCEYYPFCNHKALEKKKKVKIISVIENIPCPKNKKIIKAELRE